MSRALHTECYPTATLPHLSRLYLDYAAAHEPLTPFYGNTPYGNGWQRTPPKPVDAATLVDLLEEQNRGFGACAETLESIDKLRNGARAVVTGQQVTLFGGPFYTVLKTATAIRRAKDTGAVPIFWLASEDHDIDEADHVTLAARRELRTLRLEHASADTGKPVGGIKLGEGITALLEEAAELLGPGATLDALEAAYKPEATYAEACAGFLAKVFAGQGLVIIDASTRGFHRLGAKVLRAAIERADELESLLLERTKLLESRGYAAQVLVAPGHSLLFLIDDETGVRLPLRRGGSGEWIAGKKQFSAEELLKIVETAPERLSPSAILRPVFQDAILPTAAYIGGPSEVSYFAQSQVLYDAILGRTTPVLPRLTATLIDSQAAALLTQYGLTLRDVMTTTPDEMEQRLGARAIPAAGRKKIESAGAAMNAELADLTQWLSGLNAELGRSAEVSAGKMRYQMDRLRRLASTYILQKDTTLKKHVDALYRNLFPDGHPQERLLGSAALLARSSGQLIADLVGVAAEQCPGHKAVFLD